MDNVNTWNEGYEDKVSKAVNVWIIVYMHLMFMDSLPLRNAVITGQIHVIYFTANDSGHSFLYILRAETIDTPSSQRIKIWHSA